MNIDQALSALKFFNNKKSERIIRQTLSIILCIIITSHLFKLIYFRYELPDTFNYKYFFYYFENGEFFIPLILFIFVFISTKWIFLIYNYFRHNRIEEKVNNFSSEKTREMFGSIKNGAEMVEKILPKLFNRIKGLESSQDRWELRKIFNEKSNILEEYLIFTSRLLIVNIIAFCSVNYYGYFLFGISIIMFAIVFLFLMSLDYFAKIFPIGIIKFYDSLKKNGTAD